MGRVTRLAALPLALVFVLCQLARPVIARTVELSPTSSVSAPAVAPLIGARGADARLLVRFVSTATAQDQERAVASVGGRTDRVLAGIGVTRIAVARGATEDATGLTALRLARDPAVISVEPDSSGSVQFAPNDAYWLTDPSFGVGEWGLRAALVDKAWDFARGSPLVTVAVIDTGIDVSHPDLLGVALPGVTFVSSPDPSCTPGSSIDDNGHGTHVAGVIAANGNNGQGIAGVAFGVRILPVKALDCTGAGLLSDVASSVLWATDHGARIINISLGSNAAQATLQDAIRYAVARNVLVVAAAGNCGVASVRCGSINEPQYPGGFPEVLAVAATDQTDGHAAFSSANGYVDVSAPGVRIWSTTPTYPTTLSRANPGTSVYAAFSGTSQAAPLVSGIAALLLSSQPGLTGLQLTDRLRSTADDLGATGADDAFGAGRVNALRAVTLNAPSRYGATYDISALPRSATFASAIAAPITITNQSSFAWTTVGANPVRLAYHWTDLAGNAVVWDGQRSSLPADVPVGGSVTVTAVIAPPKTAGSYVLRIDLVREGVAWFSAGGAPSANATIGITSGLGAAYARAANAQSTLVLGSNAFLVTVTNTGTATWSAAGTTPVRLSYHWIGSGGDIVVWDGVRANLLTDLSPGQTAVVTMNVTSPAKTGPYTLRLDLVQEGVAWFSSQGVPASDLLVNVTTGLGAIYGLTAPATSFLPGSRALLPVTLTNTGLLTWSAGGATPVHAAAHVYDLLDRVLVWDGERTVLPSDVAPGQTVTLNVAVAVPPSSAAATYTFRVDLVQEGVAWFSSYGISPATSALSAVIDYRAGFSLASTTISRSTPAVTVTATNAGQTSWMPAGAAPLALGSHWLAADGSVLVWDGPRVPLAQQLVAPGASVTIVLPLASPPQGAVALVVDIVAEGLRWFGSGSPRPVTLVP